MSKNRRVTVHRDQMKNYAQLNAKNVGFGLDRTEKGITLIALIITIIVLLILAGISLSFVMGDGGILNRATNAVKTNNLAGAQEKVELELADYSQEYLTKRYVDQDSTVGANIGEYILGKLPINGDGYTVTRGTDNEANKITITLTDGTTTTGTIDSSSGKVIWDGILIADASESSQQEEEEVVPEEPTDIYVTLDGTTLRFYNQKDNVSGTLYMNNNEPYNLKNVDFTSDDSCPWYNSRERITRASIEGVIAPTSTQRWFNECAITGIDNIGRLKTDYTTNMGRMFRNCFSLEEIDVSNWETSNVTDMSVMFCNCSKLTELDLSKWDTSLVTNMQYMFCNCSCLATVYVGGKWNTDLVASSSAMFSGCNSIVGGQGTVLNNGYIDKSRARLDGGRYGSGYFTGFHLLRIPGVTHYGDYFDLGTEILGSRTNGTYYSMNKLEGESTTIKADWRIYSVDKTGLWLILADYYPAYENNNFITNTIGLSVFDSNKPYRVGTSGIRDNLLNRLNSDWRGILPIRLQNDDRVVAVGALTVSQMRAALSAYYVSPDIMVNGNENAGYPDFDILRDSTNCRDAYDKNLHFPHKSIQSDCVGYVLASKSSQAITSVMYMSYEGKIAHMSSENEYWQYGFGIRPAVHLAADIDIKQDTETGIWSISE